MLLVYGVPNNQGELDLEWMLPQDFVTRSSQSGDIITFFSCFGKHRGPKHCGWKMAYLS